MCDYGRKIRLNFGEDLFFFETTCFLAEKLSELPILAEKSDSISAKTFFFLRPPVFGRKKRLNFPFFEKFRLNFRTNRVKLIQEQCQGRLHFSHSFKKAPPPFPNPGYAPDDKYLTDLNFQTGLNVLSLLLTLFLDFLNFLLCAKILKFWFTYITDFCTFLTCYA